jgi:pyrroline-5-carboxylate reductase
MKKILFIGAGRMATAIAGGLVGRSYNADDIAAFDINEFACQKFTEATSICAVSENIEKYLEKADVVFLAVKPQFLAGAVGQISELLQSKLIISIVAGVSIEKLEKLCSSNRIIRVMPNTPALVGKGCSGFTVSENITEEEENFAKFILDSVGISFKLPEKLMDAVTALSGSGPAYVFEFADALAEGGMTCGIPMELSLEMAIATLEGAAAMLKETKVHPSILKDQVTSPGGTTLRALQVLEARDFRNTIVKAVEGACERSKELGRDA